MVCVHVVDCHFSEQYNYAILNEVVVRSSLLIYVYSHLHAVLLIWFDTGSCHICIGMLGLLGMRSSKVRGHIAKVIDTVHSHFEMCHS